MSKKCFINGKNVWGGGVIKLYVGEGHQKFKLGFREGCTTFCEHCCSLK